jgi:hypothetical protein
MTQKATVLMSTALRVSNVEIKLSLNFIKNKIMKTYGGVEVQPWILILGITWRWVLSFTRRPLYPPGKSPRYPLDMRMDGPRSRSCLRKVSSLAPAGIQTSIPDRPLRSLGTLLTEVKQAHVCMLFTQWQRVIISKSFCCISQCRYHETFIPLAASTCLWPGVTSPFSW